MPNYTMYWLVMLLAFLAVTGRLEDFITLLREGKPQTPTEKVYGPPTPPGWPGNPPSAPPGVPKTPRVPSPGSPPPPPTV